MVIVGVQGEKNKKKRSLLEGVREMSQLGWDRAEFGQTEGRKENGCNQQSRWQT